MLKKIFYIAFLLLLFGCKKETKVIETPFNILIAEENEDISSIILDYGKTKNIDINIEYQNTMDIITNINTNQDYYDAVWMLNSIWYYKLNNPSIVKNSKSTFIEPVVFGIKKSKAEELGFTIKDKKIYLQNILDAIEKEHLTFLMPSVTQTNSGASSYLGFLSCFLGNPSVLTENDFESTTIKKDLVNFFKGVSRSSGNDEFTIQMFKSGSFDAMVNYEASIINLNKELEQNNQEPLYIIYPFDGVSISDAPFGYINNGNENKEQIFKELQSYLLSSESQKFFTDHGRRGGYGGLVPYGDENTFNPSWGINTKQYLSPIKYPSISVINEALNLYQNELRKPTTVAFCLDYSTSMAGDGHTTLLSAINFILDKEESSKENLQFSQIDEIMVIPFSNNPWEIYYTNDGSDTKSLLSEINKLEPNGTTNIYDTLILALESMEENKKPDRNYSIILMTDGRSNVSSFSYFENYYIETNQDIPVYSITFGSASEDELYDIAYLTNATVFDGKYDLIKAFKTVRGYN